jgi:malate dehydrogenase
VRGSSSVASAANAAIDHVRDEQLGTPGRSWTSAAVVSRGEYGVPEGLVCSFPVRSGGIGLLGDGYEVVEGLDLDVRAQRRLAASVEELVAERDAVRELGVL